MICVYNNKFLFANILFVKLTLLEKPNARRYTETSERSVNNLYLSQSQMETRMSDLEAGIRDIVVVLDTKADKSQLKV